MLACLLHAWLLQAGNRAFHSQQYTMAVHYYDEAMQALQHEHQNGIGSSNSSSFSNNGSTSMVVLLCNRAASYLCLSCPLEALADSCTACELSAKQACLRAWQVGACMV